MRVGSNRGIRCNTRAMLFKRLKSASKAPSLASSTATSATAVTNDTFVSDGTTLASRSSTIRSSSTCIVDSPPPSSRSKLDPRAENQPDISHLPRRIVGMTTTSLTDTSFYVIPNALEESPNGEAAVSLPIFKAHVPLTAADNVHCKLYRGSETGKAVAAASVRVNRDILTRWGLEGEALAKFKSNWPREYQFEHKGQTYTVKKLRASSAGWNHWAPRLVGKFLTVTLDKTGEEVARFGRFPLDGLSDHQRRAAEEKQKAAQSKGMDRQEEPGVWGYPNFCFKADLDESLEVIIMLIALCWGKKHFTYSSRSY